MNVPQPLILGNEQNPSSLHEDNTTIHDRGDSSAIGGSAFGSGRYLFLSKTCNDPKYCQHCSNLVYPNFRNYKAVHYLV